MRTSAIITAETNKWVSRRKSMRQVPDVVDAHAPAEFNIRRDSRTNLADCSFFSSARLTHLGTANVTAPRLFGEQRRYFFAISWATFIREQQLSRT